MRVTGFVKLAAVSSVATCTLFIGLGGVSSAGDHALGPAPALAVLADGKLAIVKGGMPTSIAPVATTGTTKPMAVTGFQWSADGRYLGWQQMDESTGKGRAGWYDTLTHRRTTWSSAFQFAEGWSVNRSGVASLVAGENLNSPATLTEYGIDGVVTHRSVHVQTSDSVAGYSGGFVIGPDIVSGTRLWRVSLSGNVTTLQQLPKPAANGPPYETTAISPDGRIFAAELGDHTDGCGVGPASHIFIVNEATGTVTQARLPAGPRWRVLSFVLDPRDTLDATLADCTSHAKMSTTVLSISPSGAVTAQQQGALVATTEDGTLAYQAGGAQIAGTEAAYVQEVAFGPLTVNGRPVPGAVAAATASWAP